MGIIPVVKYQVYVNMRLFQFFNSFDFATLLLCNMYRELISVLQKGQQTIHIPLVSALFLKCLQKGHTFYDN